MPADTRFAAHRIDFALSDLASYARDRERSPGAPVMTISGKTATDMWPWLLRQMAAAAPA